MPTRVIQPHIVAGRGRVQSAHTSPTSSHGCARPSPLPRACPGNTYGEPANRGQRLSTFTAGGDKSIVFSPVLLSGKRSAAPTRSTSAHCNVAIPVRGAPVSRSNSNRTVAAQGRWPPFRRARPRRAFSAASRYRSRRRSGYFSIPWQGFGPFGRYFAVSLHARSFDARRSLGSPDTACSCAAPGCCHVAGVSPLQSSARERPGAGRCPSIARRQPSVAASFAPPTCREEPIRDRADVSPSLPCPSRRAGHSLPATAPMSVLRQFAGLVERQRADAPDRLPPHPAALMSGT